MIFIIKRGDSSKELRFTEGPVNIGRHTDSQIFLSDKGISRHHAVIFETQDATWMLEDLDSANKTYLNGEPIHKAEIKTGDIISIADFNIEVDFEAEHAEQKSTDIDDEIAAALENPPEMPAAEVQEEPSPEQATDESPEEVAEEAYEGTIDQSGETMQAEADMEDTLTAPLSSGPQIVARKIGAEQSPAIRFAGERAVDYLDVTARISAANNLDEILLAILDITEQQFDSRHVWCALREQPSGPMSSHAGRDRDGSAVEMEEIKLADKITQSVEKEEFLLFVFSRRPNMKKGEGIRSALLAPVMASSGCYGMIYVDNAIGDDHYSLSELDYLMLIGMHAAAKLENL